MESNWADDCEELLLLTSSGMTRLSKTGFVKGSSEREEEFLSQFWPGMLLCANVCFYMYKFVNPYLVLVFHAEHCEKTVRIVILASYIF